MKNYVCKDIKKKSSLNFDLKLVCLCLWGVCGRVYMENACYMNNVPKLNHIYLVREKKCTHTHTHTHQKQNKTIQKELKIKCRQEILYEILILDVLCQQEQYPCERLGCCFFFLSIFYFVSNSRLKAMNITATHLEVVHPIKVWAYLNGVWRRESTHTREIILSP